MAKVRLVGDKLATGTFPVPLRLTVCGLPAALSATLRTPVRVPEEVGVNVTLRVQLAPPATEPPQLLVCAKSPLALMLVMFRLELPGLLSITVCDGLVVPTGSLGKLRLDGDKLAPGPLKTPVPVRVKVCGLLAAPSVKMRVPFLVPAAVGVKVTVTAQVAPVARLEPHVLLVAKSPVAMIPATRNRSLLGFASVKLWEALAVPTA